MFVHVNGFRRGLEDTSETVVGRVPTLGPVSTGLKRKFSLVTACRACRGPDGRVKSCGRAAHVRHIAPGPDTQTGWMSFAHRVTVLATKGRRNRHQPSELRICGRRRTRRHPLALGAGVADAQPAGGRVTTAIVRAPAGTTPDSGPPGRPTTRRTRADPWRAGPVRDRGRGRTPPPGPAWRGIPGRLDHQPFNHQPFNHRGHRVTPLPVFGNWGFWLFGDPGRL